MYEVSYRKRVDLLNNNSFSSTTQLSSNVLLLSAMVVGNAGDLAPGGENRQQHDKTSGL